MYQHDNIAQFHWLDPMNNISSQNIMQYEIQGLQNFFRIHYIYLARSEFSFWKQY